MELRAVLELLAQVPDDPLVVQTDSAYVVGIFTEWLEVWRARGMRTSKGHKVENLDLIESIETAIEGRAVTFEKVRGHSGHPLNEAADELARSAAESARRRLPWNSGK
jgi:ribonuclease HI